MITKIINEYTTLLHKKKKNWVVDDWIKKKFFFLTTHDLKEKINKPKNLTKTVQINIALNNDMSCDLYVPI